MMAALKVGDDVRVFVDNGAHTIAARAVQVAGKEAVVHIGPDSSDVLARSVTVYASERDARSSGKPLVSVAF
jgi:hypothetical protein